MFQRGDIWDGRQAVHAANGGESELKTVFFSESIFREMHAYAFRGHLTRAGPSVLSQASRQPCILTLKLDEHAFSLLNGLRRTCFPPERNFIPAHITLFHSLPGEEEQSLVETLHSLCTRTEVVGLSFPGARFLGRGVAIEVRGPGLVDVRERLASLWPHWLSAQDRQGFRPHVTIQNKVPAATARSLFESLQKTWQPFDGRGVGLLLWRYQGGPWEPAGEFPFQDPARDIPGRRS